MASPSLTLPRKQRRAIWKEVETQIERYLATVESLPVAPLPAPKEISAALAPFDFKSPKAPATVVKESAELLRRFLLHTAHPAYYGVFNPAASTMGVAADALVAAFNPQLASTASARVCIEIERRLIRYFGEKFGFERRSIEGSFCSGGTAANHTALLCALTRRLPRFARRGLETARPVLYASKETHHSILRAARLCGLGTEAVRELPVDAALRFDIGPLRKQVKQDRAAGRLPLFLVATLGSTSAGMFDDVEALARIARRENLWLHADAAWGGAAILLREHRWLFAGVERADSIALDAHKWLSVQMGAAMFLTRRPGILEATFRVDRHSPYMPKTTYAAADFEPYKQSLEWSRRFAGLKLFMTLAAHGESGYQRVLRHQIAMGDYLRERLSAAGWTIANRAALPVVCFYDAAHPDIDLDVFARKVAETGKTWITTTRLEHDGRSVLRAGISNFATQPRHIDALVETLGRVRDRFAASRRGTPR